VGGVVWWEVSRDSEMLRGLSLSSFSLKSGNAA